MSSVGIEKIKAIDVVVLLAAWSKYIDTVGPTVT